MSGLSEKFVKVRAQGFVRTFEIQFNRFIPASVFRYSKGDIFEFDIDKLKNSAANLIDDENLECVKLTRSSPNRDWQRLRDFSWNSVPNDTTLNDFGYAIIDKNDPEKFLGGLWAAIGSFSENNLGIEFHFKPEQAWLYCAFVDRNARGRGIYKRLISFAAADLEQSGYRQLLGIVQPWNRISRAMHEKSSLGIVGRMSAIRCGPFVKVWSTGQITVDRTLVTRPTESPALVSISPGLSS